LINSAKFDVIIIGAGPAGIICALQLAKKNYHIALIEKKQFPKDKICGDALSLDVVNQLKLIDEKLYLKFLKFSNKIETYGVKIIAPNHQSFDIPFNYKGKPRVAYVSKRKDFDNFLFNELKSFSNIKFFENTKVDNIDIVKKKVKVSFKDNHQKILVLESKIIVGADGTQSYVAKTLSNIKIDYRHYSAGLRVYYENVSDFNVGNFIELHFLKEILPGYLWIFPLPNNQANVGVGMLSKYVSKKKINLKSTLELIIKEHPQFKERFKNAKALETVKGFGLPLGNSKRNISGERFILLGDAAGLIDPFSGEGVGNAIRSARVGAEHIEKCFEINNFSKKQNLAYDKEIYKRMGKEFTVSRSLQKLCRYPKLFNFIVKKANNNKELRNFLIGTMEDVEKKKILTKPSFYYRLLFRK
jgi:geranylgeranyl reductase family protein